ncbi:hypothetical protein CUT44_15415 [Streptomyces carminius]|uniref:Uncharacterized protein n=1 Tax=Streptomyces carminius TaxID=2665496 RepID=A0A2M8LYB6_9ACTN|nr:hypothetical protein [Streptomyces carminius]PJE96941.1 hypothetical protein CUT44_15415 [Streptomyces carminius]
MRTVFMFPVAERADTAACLDRHLAGGGGSWTFAEGLYVVIDDEETGCLFRDWAPEEVALLEAALGYHPTWAVQVDVSGRIDGTAEVRRLAALLLRQGGVAFDDYSEHAWTLREIESDALFEGLRFFDFRTYHERHRRPTA